MRAGDIAVGTLFRYGSPTGPMVLRLEDGWLVSTEVNPTPKAFFSRTTNRYYPDWTFAPNADYNFNSYTLIQVIPRNEDAL